MYIFSLGVNIFQSENRKYTLDERDAVVIRVMGFRGRW